MHLAAHRPRLDPRPPRRRATTSARARSAASSRLRDRSARRSSASGSSSSAAPGSVARTRATSRAAMGLLDYYRQFEGMTDEEVSGRAARAGRRAPPQGARPDRRRSTSRTRPGTSCRTPTSSTRSRSPPARGAQPRRTTRTAHELRARARPPARRRARPRRRRQRRRPAARVGRAALLEPGRRAGDAVAVLPALPADGPARRRARRAGPGGLDVDAAARRRHGDRTRVIALCNPNDPTARYLPAAELRALLDALPEHVTLLLDEALADFVDAEPPGALAGAARRPPAPADLPHVLEGLRPRRPALRLRARRPGLRAAARAARAGARRRPTWQAGALEALRSAAPQVARRRAAVAGRARAPAGALRATAARRRAERRRTSLWLRAPGPARRRARRCACSTSACSSRPARASATTTTCRATIQAPRRRPTACSTRCAARSGARPPSALVRRRLPQQRAGRLLEDLAPGAASAPARRRSA